MLMNKPIDLTVLEAVDVKCKSLIHNQGLQTSTPVVAGSISSSKLANSAISKDVQVLSVKLPERAVAVEAKGISSSIIGTENLIMNEVNSKI